MLGFKACGLSYVTLMCKKIPVVIIILQRMERQLREDRRAQWMASLRGPGWARQGKDEHGCARMGKDG